MPQANTPADPPTPERDVADRLAERITNSIPFDNSVPFDGEEHWAVAMPRIIREEMDIEGTARRAMVEIERYFMRTHPTNRLGTEIERIIAAHIRRGRVGHGEERTT